MKKIIFILFLALIMVSELTAQPTGIRKSDYFGFTLLMDSSDQFTIKRELRLPLGLKITGGVFSSTQPLLLSNSLTITGNNALISGGNMSVLNGNINLTTGNYTWNGTNFTGIFGMLNDTNSWNDTNKFSYLKIGGGLFTYSFGAVVLSSNFQAANIKSTADSTADLYVTHTAHFNGADVDFTGATVTGLTPDSTHYVKQFGNFTKYDDLTIGGRVLADTLTSGISPGPSDKLIISNIGGPIYNNRISFLNDVGGLEIYTEDQLTLQATDSIYISGKTTISSSSPFRIEVEGINSFYSTDELTTMSLYNGTLRFDDDGSLYHTDGGMNITAGTDSTESIRLIGTIQLGKDFFTPVTFNSPLIASGISVDTLTSSGSLYVGANIIPTVNNSINLGASGQQYNDVNAKRFIENGTNISSIYYSASTLDTSHIVFDNQQNTISENMKINAKLAIGTLTAGGINPIPHFVVNFANLDTNYIGMNIVNTDRNLMRNSQTQARDTSSLGLFMSLIGNPWIAITNNAGVTTFNVDTVGTITAGNFIPRAAATYSLGSSSIKFISAYSEDYYTGQNGTYRFENRGRILMPADGEFKFVNNATTAFTSVTFGSGSITAALERGTVDTDITGLALRSPDGTKWYAYIDNSGNWVTSITHF